MSGAKVTVRDMETGATRVVMTDSSGSYRALALPVGRYELTVEKSGFETADWAGIKLFVGEEAVENLRLGVAGTAEQITVSTETPVVNTTTADVSGLVGEREVKDLPLNGRSFDNLITLNPGTVNYTPMLSQRTTTSNGNEFSVNGQRPGDNETLLNGVEYGGSSQLAVTPGGASGFLLGVDAVREFNALTDTYPAEYGKRAGAQVVVVTQSGSNALHGDVYEFLRNNALDARNYFDPGPTPQFKRNQFGASLGGPLKKDRLFFFGNYEGFRQRGVITGTTLSFVPDNCVRSGGLPNASGVCVPVPGASALMKQYANTFWPAQNGAELGGGIAKSFNTPEQSINEDFGTLKLDYNISPRDMLSVAYTVDEGNALNPQADPLFASALSVGSQVVSVQETRILSPQVINTFTAGFSRAAFNNDSAPAAAFLASYSPALDFVAGRGPGGITIGGGLTTTGGGVITAAGPNNASNVWNRRNLFTFSDSVQISRGIHQISVGASLQRLQDNEDTASRQAGQATFPTLQAFLQGKVTTLQAVPKPAELGWRTLIGAWFVEDAIKLRHNLTVEAGLRHEFDTGWNEAQGRAANFITDANGVLVTSPRIGGSAFTQNNAKWLFGPRVALAWDPLGHGTTVIHAGFGIYYSLLDALAFQLNSVAGPDGFNGTISQTR